MQATTGFNLLDPSSWPGTLFLQVVAGLLLLAVDGELWNRFKIDQTGGRLSGTTDTDVRSVFGQYLLPQHRDLSAASVSSVPDVPALSREAQTLLKEGVQDSAGKLVRILSLNG